MRIKLLFILILSLIVTELSSQVKLNSANARSRNSNDTSDVKRSRGFKNVATIDMYLKFDTDTDTTIVDTTITIKKDYKFNYLQKDNFGLMPFANIGQTYNTLSFNSFSEETNPLFGARARHFNYYENEDIKYYEVPTPWTRLTYKTAFEQGQMLDAFFTLNLSRQLNFSIAYKGLRSLGNYQNTLTSSGNFRFTSSYATKNKRYKAKAHIVMQDLLNQENGGIRDEDIENFESGNEDFIDRSVFDPNFENAENILVGRRFFINQSYDIIKQKDSLSQNELAIISNISLEDKYYQFYHTTAPANEFFGDSFTDDINDKVTLEHFRTSLGLKYLSNIIGELMFALNYTDFNYGYNSVVIFPDENIPNRIKSSFLGVEAEYKKAFKGFGIEGNGRLNLSNEFVGSYLSGKINLKLFDDLLLSGGISISSRLPNFNHLLYQSDYINFNWYNLDSFKNINTQQLVFSLKSEKLFNADLDISNIDNYTYFNLDSTLDQVKIIKPRQYDSSIQYLRLKVNKELRLGNFALDNTIMYQNVISDDEVLNVPTLISRNTLYYSNQVFKKAMTLQTGVTLNYFTKYNMNGYDPLLAEFYTQNETEIGGFPRLDFFINAKVRQTRIFLKAEHFNSSFTGYNYFSAPNHPYRDFTVRFGLVWDFFL
ncbi:putative porin [Winogradskyella sp.]|uniref:putative porin n=1 Tax=Winogradskyella sp. TaxID=1883156 RepID=UPI002637AEA5|nr:putative porin [Winogradskyella sp.]